MEEYENRSAGSSETWGEDESRVFVEYGRAMVPGREEIERTILDLIPAEPDEKLRGQVDAALAAEEGMASERRYREADEAKNASRLPPGHPEAFIEAFANVYAGVADEIRIRKGEREPGGAKKGFPTVHDGARGVHFIEKAVESARSDRRWTDARWTTDAADGNAASDKGDKSNGRVRGRPG